MTRRLMAKRPRSGDDRESRVVALDAWLRKRGARLDGLAIRETGPADLGVFATRAFKPGDAIGFLPRNAILDPIEVLENDATAKRAVELGATPPFAFWLSLACGLKDEKHPFHPYLSSLPPEAPDPCAWPANARALLLGTPLATQVEKQRRVLRASTTRSPSGGAAEYVAANV